MNFLSKSPLLILKQIPPSIELRLAKGGKVLGFLNPWIYKVGAPAFNDVTLGRNCGNVICGKDAGFPAIKGWDPATGFGTPDFAALSKLV